MKNVNKSFLLGRLGTDPIRRETKQGRPVVQFRVATSRGEQEAQWHTVVVWGKTADHCAQYLKKGALVFVEGELRTHTYNTKDGQSRLAVEVHAEDVSFLTNASRPEIHANDVVEAEATT